MVYLSDANVRAVLRVLVGRLGGDVDISNEELYSAMMPANGLTDASSSRRRQAVSGYPCGTRTGPNPE